MRLLPGSSARLSRCFRSGYWNVSRGTAAAGHGGSSQPHTASPSVKELAKFAQIAVSDAEVSDWQPKINSIVEWFGQLQQVDVSNVEPAIHVHQQGNVLRSDQPALHPARSELIAQAPAVERAYIRVPKAGGSSTNEASTPGAPSESAAAPAAPAALAAAGSAPAAQQDSGAAAAALSAVQALDIRVGKILSCERHPDADSLYVENIDVGEPEPRTIVSGLVKYVPIDQMQNRMVVVLCNLKPRNMRGIKSFGMVLAASDAAHETVEPLMPPAGAAPGERAWVGNYKDQPSPAVPNAVEKKKLWDQVQPQLKTSTDRIACWQGLPMNTAAGPITSTTLTNARIA